MTAADIPHAKTQMVQVLQPKGNAACARAPCICTRGDATRVVVFTPEALSAMNVAEGSVHPARRVSSSILLPRRLLTRASDVTTPQAYRALWGSLAVHDVNHHLALRILRWPDVARVNFQHISLT